MRIHGDHQGDDATFPALAVSTEFHRALAAAGYNAEVMVVEGALHGSVWRVGEETFTVAVQAVSDLSRD